MNSSSSVNKFFVLEDQNEIVAAHSDNAWPQGFGDGVGTKPLRNVLRHIRKLSVAAPDYWGVRSLEDLYINLSG